MVVAVYDRQLSHHENSSDRTRRASVCSQANWILHRTVDGSLTSPHTAAADTGPSSMHEGGVGYAVTPRTKVKRSAARGRYDRDTVHAILDEAFLCHVAYVEDDQPFVIPTAYCRIGDKVYLHGHISNKLLKSMKGGVPICMTVTLLDGLVLARSTFHHSMNYRSCVILGTGEAITDLEEKRAVLEAIVEHIVPGRNVEARQPTEAELKATSVVSLELSEVSAKVRTGPPIDDKQDMELPIWAGVLPIDQVKGVGQPQPDPKLMSGLAVPQYIAQYHRLSGSAA